MIGALPGATVTTIKRRTAMELKTMITGAVLVKAVVMTAVLTAIGSTFAQSLILIVTSSTITGLTVMAAAVITARATRHHDKKLDDVKRIVGATRRAEDHETPSN